MNDSKSGIKISETRNMDMEIAGASKPEEGKLLVVMLVGAPGSGKSTFCEHVMRCSARPWVRVCQDTIGNGKAGNKAICIKAATNALMDGKSVFIDRCNLDRKQRSEFLRLEGTNIDVHAVILDLPAKLCISRSVKRTGHEGNLQGGRAAAIVNTMLQKKELPKISEGFNRITFCQDDNDIKAAIDTYSQLGPSDNLPDGCYGQKAPDAKVQVGIMKFLKKMEVPVHTNAASKENDFQKSVSPRKVEQIDPCYKDIVTLSGNADLETEKGKDYAACSSVSGAIQASLDDVPTLAFPSISTSDFQFDHENAADIILEEVAKFTNSIGNARLALVDLSHKSRILSLIKAKAGKYKIDSEKFFTHVGDITCLYSEGGLRCNVIANAANWRLKPGGGGVNAAIYNAAGPELEVATKEHAKSLSPGNAVVVPLPPTSALYTREGVTHVIHVLGPNMNPQRPNCLNNDYNKGCEILREAYNSLFQGFASLIRNQANEVNGFTKEIGSKILKLQCNSEGNSQNQHSNNGQKNRRNDVQEYERNKKWRGSQNDFRAANENSGKAKTDGVTKKTWGSWAQALFRIAMHPEYHLEVVLQMSEDVVVLNDLYPKAQKHLLVLARTEGIDSLKDVGKEHIHLLRTMHDVGLAWAEKFVNENSSLAFRLGYHSVPSMAQLHLHVVSQDFDSKHLKNKKHWNSFNTDFFRDSLDVIDEVENHGKAIIKDSEEVLSMELRCNRCRSAHPNIPRLKSHVSSCQAPFPALLLQNGRLVRAP